MATVLTSRLPGLGTAISRRGTRTLACLLVGIVPVCAVATRVAVAQLPDSVPSAPRPDNTQLSYQVFLVGNTGNGTREDLAPTLSLLRDARRRCARKSRGGGASTRSH